MRYVELKSVGLAPAREPRAISFLETSISMVREATVDGGPPCTEIHLCSGFGPFLVEGTASEVWAEIQRQLDAQKPVFAPVEIKDPAARRSKLRDKICELKADINACRARNLRLQQRYAELEVKLKEREATLKEQDKQLLEYEGVVREREQGWKRLQELLAAQLRQTQGLIELHTDLSDPGVILRSLRASLYRTKVRNKDAAVKSACDAILTTLQRLRPLTKEESSTEPLFSVDLLGDKPDAGTPHVQ